MRKAIVVKCFTRECYGDLGQIINAREEIARGGKNYGVYWKFNEVDVNEFLKEVEKNKKICCVKTLSGKYVEVDKSNLNRFEF